MVSAASNGSPTGRQMAKLTKHGEAWRGQWQLRLVQELQRRGFASLRAFARDAGCVTYTDIASALDGPFAPIQMMMAVRAEFEKEADFRGFVVDSLARYLIEYTAANAEQRTQRESQAARAVGACAAAIGDANQDALFRVWDTVRERILDGWLPAGPHDPILTTVVNAELWRDR